MDMLKSEQDKLCVWLSCDPDYILQQCGNILSMNDFLEVQKQSSALDKMRVLLKVIMQKGGDAPRCFFDILKQHQAHYQPLQQLFNPNTDDSPTPMVVADSNSVVTVRQITDVKGKALSMNIQTVSGAGSRPTGNNAGKVPQADYAACDGSVICADKISGVTVDGDIDLSVSVKPSQQILTHAFLSGPVDETLPFSQGPAVKMITEHKVELTDCLRPDHSFILHAKHIVSDNTKL